MERLPSRTAFAAALLAALVHSAATIAGAPPWVRSQVSVPLPNHEADTGAILLYSETDVVVRPTGKIRELERKVFRILRPDGAQRGVVRLDFDSRTRILDMRGWCIPLEGKEYQVSDRDAVETGLVGVLNGELMSDVRTRILRIPAAAPGSVVGFEIETERQPYVMEDEWPFQETVPVREARYTLELPAGWEYKVSWINHPEVAGKSIGPRQWQWTVDDVQAVPLEQQMPPWRAISGRLMVTLLPPGDARGGFRSWNEMGLWYANLLAGRLEPSPAIKQQVAALTARSPTTLAKMQALASFVQQEIRYVAVELGVGGFQPHAAAETLEHRYGDCKDKAALLSTMLKEIGVESYLVIVNSERGAITDGMPANLGFDHVILAMALPPGAEDRSLTVIESAPGLGRLLFFDPTDSLTPFGRLAGSLQSGFGLLVGPRGGELMRLPRSPEEASGMVRTARLALDANGTLTGDVHELWQGDPASRQRAALDDAAANNDRIKPVESRLADSLSNFQITKAVVVNRTAPSLPLEWSYSIAADRYARVTGNLLLVRPRVFGEWSSGLLETERPRRYPIELEELEKNVDEFDITLPPGFAADDLPPPVDAEYDFAAYHSKTEVVAGSLRYRRSLEIKQLVVPADRAEDLKRLYRTIDNDERMVAVFEKKGP